MAVMHLILQETPWKISMLTFHFWVQDQTLWNGPPRIGKSFKFISEFRIKSCWMAPHDLTSGGNFWNSTFACTVKWCMQICHKPFSPSAESHSKILIYCIFYWKCRFEMAVMHLILQKTPWKISMLNFHFWVQDQKLWNGPHPWSDIWWKFLKFYFCMYCTMMHVNCHI